MKGTCSTEQTRPTHREGQKGRAKGPPARDSRRPAREEEPCDKGPECHTTESALSPRRSHLKGCEQETSGVTREDQPGSKGGRTWGGTRAAELRLHPAQGRSTGQTGEGLRKERSETSSGREARGTCGFTQPGSGEAQASTPTDGRKSADGVTQPLHEAHSRLRRDGHTQVCIQHGHDQPQGARCH